MSCALLSLVLLREQPPLKTLKILFKFWTVTRTEKVLRLKDNLSYFELFLIVCLFVVSLVSLLEYIEERRDSSEVEQLKVRKILFTTYTSIKRLLQTKVSMSLRKKSNPSKE